MPVRQDSRAYFADLALFIPDGRLYDIIGFKNQKEKLL